MNSKTSQPRVAIVGAGTLLGKELAEEIANSVLAVANTILLDSEEATGQLDAVGDEPTVVQQMEPSALEGVDVALFADPKMAAEYGKVARQMGVSVVDLTGALEAARSAPVVSPLVAESLGLPSNIGLETTAITAAHPAAIMLALLLAQLAKSGKLRSVSALVLQPASENGRAALDELHQQTVNLLSFQSVQKTEFDAQVAFNLLPSFGEETRHPISATSERIRRHFRALAGDRLPEPLLQVVQAPVFHGFAIGVFVEFEKPVQAGDVEQRLSHDHLEVTREDSDPPSNLSAAGQEKVLVCLRAPAQTESDTRYAFWMTADNLKFAARTALGSAVELLRVRPSGNIQ